MKAEQTNRASGYVPFPGPVVAVILDGMGMGPKDGSDGVHVAHTPVLDSLLGTGLFTPLKAHGLAVGLPSDGDMGNSEVGHNALGAGRIFSQGAKLVNEALDSGRIFEGATWARVLEQARQGGVVHFIGMVSDGNVHSHIDQLFKLIDRCVLEGITTVRVHGLLDGRDVAAKSGLHYFRALEEKLAAASVEGRDYRIASGGGRMVTTMDRYNADWRIVERGWQAHVLGEGRFFPSATAAIQTYYDEDPEQTDQYMDSFVIAEEGQPVGTIEDGDAVILFNYRGDRAVEISRAFDEVEFREFDRRRYPRVFYAGMMQYDGDARIPNHYLVEPPAISGTLGEYLCEQGVSSYAISETQKFGHVTYFWNGNRSGYIDEQLERYVEIPSDRVPFDQRPWMKAEEITVAVIQAIAEGRHKFIRLNYANGDMVGHTGVESSVRIAVETVDLCLGRLLEAVKKAGGIVLVTADHGNADCMWTEKNGQRLPMVAHTRNPVPCVIQDYNQANGFALAPVEQPGLANVAATLCTLLGLTPPAHFEPSLLCLEA
ncbi:2,3-bisphosphoglycerate-independent phosphoglycerate mutase [Desulfogranum mediterraneum]|uniref:2,3-bisphosphoglycerate-independent phosphoglycerate mutase n=1 Tax=Desulfogranum mediterraneum TaxID=160661 RepID=UPI00048E7D9A|nr:2,3-bisphosphoglycerate-independent phosphoglycerate mutase [Desulfogranum mediterraneum]